MTVTLMPDVEYVLYSFLFDQTEVTNLVSDRIYRAALPPTPQGPLIRLVKIGGVTLTETLTVLDQSRVQIDCYGGSQRDAVRLAETVRQVLSLRMRNYVHAEGTIVSAYGDPPAYIPDPGWNTDRGGPKPRYTFDATIVSKLPSPAA